jgi:hypothetical protein
MLGATDAFRIDDIGASQRHVELNMFSMQPTRFGVMAYDGASIFSTEKRAKTCFARLWTR